MNVRRNRTPLVIMLSGPSSSGKTTLAKALQQRLPDPAVLLEADRTFPGLPTTHSGWRARGSQIVLAFHRAVRAWAESGFDVIVDGSLPYEDVETRAACVDLFRAYDLRLVGVTAPVFVLENREAARAERRPLGWAARQAQDIHDGMKYAALVNTSVHTPEVCADQLIRDLSLHLGTS